MWITLTFIYHTYLLGYNIFSYYKLIENFVAAFVCFSFYDSRVFFFVCSFPVCQKSCICNICWFFLFVTFSCSGISTSALATTNMSDVRPCSFQRQIVFFLRQKGFLIMQNCIFPQLHIRYFLYRIAFFL